MNKFLVSLLIAFQIYAVQAQNIDESTLPEKQQIESKIRKDYHLKARKINFEVMSEDEHSGFLGIYAPWCDSLKLNYYEIERFSARNFLDSDSLLKRVMEHEIVHYRVDKIREKLDIEYVFDNQYSRDLFQVYVEFLGANEREQGATNVMFQRFVDMKSEELTAITISKMIDEGIAMYYDNNESKPLETSWPTSIMDIKTFDQYHGYAYYAGWNLMYSIISEYGKKGIKHVLKNMPRNDEFSDLQGYQKRILEELAK